MVVEEEDEDEASSLAESFASRPSSSLLSPLTTPVTLRRGDDGSGPVADMIAVVVASRGRVCESMLLYSLYSIVLLPRPPEDWLTRYIAGVPPPPPAAAIQCCYRCRSPSGSVPLLLLFLLSS